MPHHRILAALAAIAAAASASCSPIGESARALDESQRSTRLSVDTSTAGIDVRQFAQLRGGPDRLEENVQFGVLLGGGDFVFASWHSERPLYIANLGSGAIRPLLGVGGGPREVMAISAIHRGTADSVFVFDAMNRRVNVLSPRGEWVSSFRAEIAALSPDLVRTGSGDFVFAGWIAAADRLGRPLHMVGRDGQLGPSFGVSASTAPSVTHDDRFAMQRRVVLEPGGTLLSVAVGSYVIER